MLSSVPCSSLVGVDGIPTGPVAGFALSGNTLTGGTAGPGPAFVNMMAISPFSQDEKVVVSFNDTFTLPPAPAGDVYKITEQAAWLGDSVASSPYGTNADGEMTAGPFTNPMSYTRCLHASCIHTTILPADEVPSVNVQGNAFLYVGTFLNNHPINGGPNGVSIGYSEFVTLERFKADGVTPDVFTPEPSSLSLGFLGVLADGGLLIRRRWA